ncbi:helix-turn-helix domain-containing protein [uncultured Nostoc sp.]|uniref:helix-turn-helix domain-containing protein n=1 Tax=uncultured Nostoc sp. TaxID=340711 RepID=UPI0035CA8D6E
MLLGLKTELKLNNSEPTQLLKHCGVSRHAWNWELGLTKQILDHNRVNPTEKIKFPSAIDLHKWLVALVKPEVDENDLCLGGEIPSGKPTRGSRKPKKATS